MNSLSRNIHEAWNSFCKITGRKLHHLESVEDRVKLQSAGTHQFDNPLKALIYGEGKRHSSYSWEDSYLSTLEDVFLTGDEAQVFSNKSELFVPCHYPHQDKLNRVKIRRPIPIGAQRVSGTVFHLSGRNHENKGHFILQHLPRLLAARDKLEEIDDYRILVAPGHAKWQKPLIEMIGFDPDCVIEGSRGTLRVEKLLYIPLFYGDNALNAPEYNVMLRDAAHRLTPDAIPASGRPLFISRKDAPDKRLINEDAIIDICREELGDIEIFTFAGKSLQDQIRLYNEAPFVIGPIGQGITNIIFSKASLLITLMPGKPDNGPYHTGHTDDLALVCGNESVSIFNEEKEMSRGNWSFPENKFRDQLRTLILHSKAGQALKART